MPRGRYEVLVDTSDTNWGFELRPTLETGQRTWWFRAENEDDRLAWAQRLVAATYVAASNRRGSTARSHRRSVRFG